MARSDPLVIDKATGEPTVVAASASRYPAWKLIVRDQVTGKRNQKLYSSFREAREEAAKIQEQYGERVEAHVVSRQMGYGPPYSKVSNHQLLEANESGKYWCPYCRKFRTFLWSPRLETRICEFCHIPSTEWHVQRCNPILWEKDYFNRIFRGDER